MAVVGKAALLESKEEEEGTLPPGFKRPYWHFAEERWVGLLCSSSILSVRSSSVHGRSSVEGDEESALLLPMVDYSEGRRRYFQQGGGSFYTVVFKRISSLKAT